MDLLAGVHPLLQFAITIAVNAFLITYLFPKLKGFSFTGSYWPQGILYAVGIEVTSLVLGFIAMAVVIATFGVAAIPLAFFLMFGFWLLNAIYLKVLAHYLPDHMSIDGWSPAIIAGLIMMAVSLILGDGSSINITVN